MLQNANRSNAKTGKFFKYTRPLGILRSNLLDCYTRYLLELMRQVEVGRCLRLGVIARAEQKKKRDQPIDV